MKILRDQEKDLHEKLLKLYSDHVILAITGNIPIEHIKYRYEKVVRMKLRKSVYAAYLQGIDTIDKHIKRFVPEFEVFPTATDFINMAQLTKKAEDHYWHNLNEIANREQTWQLTSTKAGDAVEKKKSFDHDSSMLDVAVSTVFSSYNKAVASKYPNSLGLAAPKTKMEESRTAAIEPTDILTGGLIGLGFAGALQTGVKLKWQTMEDVKVCNTGIAPFNCQDMNQREFETNDPELPVFPVHKWCRCFWVPVESGIDWQAILQLSALTTLAISDINRRNR